MGVWNDLRRNIVHRLIRPEDGYIPTGYVTKLYRVDNQYKYIMERITPIRKYYYEPTLAGWREVSVNSSDLVETEFTEWAHGILSSIYAEYSKRLENITLNELNQYKTKKKSEKFVINKQSFCDIMHALDKYWDNLRDLEGILDVVFEDNMLTHVFDRVVDALVEDLEPERDFFEVPMINQWLFDFDCGRNERAKEGIDGYPLTSAEELYDYLMHKKSLKETLDKFENM